MSVCLKYSPFKKGNVKSGIKASTFNVFTGVLDSYTTNLIEVYSPFKKLLTSYNGNAIRVRRSSDNSLQWICFKTNGEWDEDSYLSFIGAGNGFAHTVPGQSNARDLIQTSTSAQPQIAKDSNGHYYLYAPSAGFTTTRMIKTGLSIACDDFTMWHVHSSASYATVPFGIRYNAAAKERNAINYSSSIAGAIQDNASGTVANIGSTGTGVYSYIFSGGQSGNKSSNRLTSSTGTRITDSFTINEMGLGMNAGGAFWSQNSRIYIAAIWSEDKTNSADFDALATLGKTIITTSL